MELKKVASPNGFSGEIELELEEFQALFGHPIRVFVEKEEKELKTMDLYLEIMEEKGRLWFPNEKNGEFVLQHPRLGDMKERVLEGDVLTITGMAEDAYLAGVSVKIKNPLAIYRPKIAVKPIAKSKPAYGFQIVNRTNKKALLKIDTSNVITRHILDLYADNEQFEVIHIPEFQTNERFVNAFDDLFSDKKIYENYLSVARFDKHFLPEYHQFQGELVELNWGNLSANPSSENYTVAEFRKNFRKKMTLTVGEEELDMQSFRLIHKPKNVEAVAYHSDNIQDDFFRLFLRKTSEETSVYFDEIIIQKYGRYYYLPIDFVFNIGKNRDSYTLTIEASDSTTIKSSERSDRSITFEHYKMSELIAQLTGDERMEFENKAAEPTLDVHFSSEFLSTRQGENLILKKLYQQYYYTSTIRFENRKVWVIQPVEDSEKLYKSEFYYYIQPYLEAVLAQHQAEGLETLIPGFMDDLASLIESRFDVLVFNETGLKKAYGLGLDMSSFENFRQHLEENYGLKMTEEERIVKVTKVSFSG